MTMKNIARIRSELKLIKGACFAIGNDRPVIPMPWGNPNDAIEKLEEGVRGTPIVSLSDNNEEFLDKWRKEAAFKQYDKQVSALGIDALAWYVSFHNSTKEWGIYIPISALHYIAEKWLASSRLPLERRFQVGLGLLLEHELFHFATDYTIAQWEILMRSPCRATLVKRLGGDYLHVEEKLANAYMLRQISLGISRRTYDLLVEATKGQPAGYKDGHKYTGIDEFKSELSELTKAYISPWVSFNGLNIWSDATGFLEIYPIFPEVDSSQCPIYIIHDERYVDVPPLAVKFIPCLPIIEETKKFKKHLKRCPPDIKKRWQRKRKALSESVPKYPEFERLKGQDNIYSIRLSKNYRAHLQPKVAYDIWEAISVGTHKEMGHG